MALTKQNNYDKATKIVNVACGVFSDAITSVEKANALLLTDIAAKQNSIDSMKSQIEALQKKIVDTDAEIDKYEDQLKKNSDLITQLSAYVPSNN